MQTPSGFTLLLAQAIQDAAGNLLGTAAQPGSMTAMPTDEYDQPIAASAGGTTGGLIAVTPSAPFPVVNGTLPANAWVPDVSQTRPQYIAYRLTFRNFAGEPVLILRGVQPTGPSLNLDTYQPASAEQLAPTYANTSTDPFTGTQYQIMVLDGQMVAIAVALLNGTPFVYFFADQNGSGINWALYVYRGSLVWKAVGAYGDGVAGITFVDSNGAQVTLSVVNGGPVETPASGVAAAVAQILIADSANGNHFSLSFSNGSRVFAPAA